jgi:hypothetical protein
MGERGSEAHACRIHRRFSKSTQTKNAPYSHREDLKIDLKNTSYISVTTRFLRKPLAMKVKGLIWFWVFKGLIGFQTVCPELLTQKSVSGGNYRGSLL